MTQGIVALDIDGTVVSRNQNLSPALISTLSAMHDQGWKILFATGRTSAWSMHLLGNLPFPYVLAAFNGATILSYPGGERLHSSTLSLKDILSVSLYIDRFGVFAYEMEGEERIFATKKNYSEFLKGHLEKRKVFQNETWVECSSIQEFPLTKYASLRFFVMKSDALFLQQALEENEDLLPLMMKDSLSDEVSIIQVTAQGASKGSALRYICKKYAPQAGTIGAGDDMNDLDLLETADIGIAVGDAPQELRKIAYLLASSPEVLHLSLERAKDILMKRIS